MKDEPLCAATPQKYIADTGNFVNSLIGTMLLLPLAHLCADGMHLSQGGVLEQLARLWALGAGAVLVDPLRDVLTVVHVPVGRHHLVRVMVMVMVRVRVRVRVRVWVWVRVRVRVRVPSPGRPSARG